MTAENLTTTLSNAKRPRRDLKDLTNLYFGYWHVLSYAGRKSKASLWLCECICAAKKIVRAPSLQSGRSVSCGCQKIKKATEHGHARKNNKSPEYKAYMAARDRCKNPKNESYCHYGQRGIEFRFVRFAEFLAEVGLRPSTEHSIDRIDVNGHYEPGNLRWATLIEQANNKQRSKR